MATNLTRNTHRSSGVYILISIRYRSLIFEHLVLTLLSLLAGSALITTATARHSVIRCRGVMVTVGRAVRTDTM
jgi:hypothetical protein